MAFHRVTARYAGTCKRCHGAITVGQTIRYGGPGRTYHYAAECPASAQVADLADPFGIDRLAEERETELAQERF